MKLNEPEASNSRHVVAPKSTFSPGSLGRIGLGATLCEGDMMNLTIPPRLIAVDDGVYDVSLLSLVVTIGMEPGGQVTVRTVAALASIAAGASGDGELPPLH